MSLRALRLDFLQAARRRSGAGVVWLAAGVAAAGVVLLGIAPDAKAGMVQISAQAADAQAMFDYLGRLAQQRELSQVYLLQHQHERQKTLRPIRFLVSASWMPR